MTEGYHRRTKRFSPNAQLLSVTSIWEEYDSLSNDGFRVLAVATKDLRGKQICNKGDERELVLRGYVAFLDPPKDTAAHALAALHSHGVGVKTT
ncbi:MAG TPA: hypothetical protein VGH37_04360 [Candidatus Acidoferrum sp.]|jgi:Mg2+-importing ATPase